MGLALTVEGTKVNFQLSDYEIRGYEFDYHASHSKYAKGFEDVRSLRIIGDISRIIEKNRDILELIRRWAKQEYTDDTYYNSVKATYTYSEDLVREIVFPDAFIKEYKETINPHTGHGTFTILFLQKFSKRTAVEIAPFDNFSNESANTLAESQKILVASLDNNLARLAPEYHGLGGAALALTYSDRPFKQLPVDTLKTERFDYDGIEDRYEFHIESVAEYNIFTEGSFSTKFKLMKKEFFLGTEVYSDETFKEINSSANARIKSILTKGDYYLTVYNNSGANQTTPYNIKIETNIDTRSFNESTEGSAIWKPREDYRLSYLASTQSVESIGYIPNYNVPAFVLSITEDELLKTQSNAVLFFEKLIIAAGTSGKGIVESALSGTLKKGVLKKIGNSVLAGVLFDEISNFFELDLHSMVINNIKSVTNCKRTGQNVKADKGIIITNVFNTSSIRTSLSSYLTSFGSWTDFPKMTGAKGYRLKDYWRITSRDEISYPNIYII